MVAFFEFYLFCCLPVCRLGLCRRGKSTIPNTADTGRWQLIRHRGECLRVHDLSVDRTISDSFLQRVGGDGRCLRRGQCGAQVLAWCLAFAVVDEAEG